MRARLEKILNETWYGERKPGVVLSVLEKAYRALSALHRRFGESRSATELENKYIIVVGNLTAGGAGKTPLVIRLCELAVSCGLKPGVISRGYGRKSSGALMISEDMDPRDTGDEPYLISKRCGVPVAVDAQRERAAAALFESGVNLVISDDGLQRAQLPRTLEICVVDQQRGFGNGRLLPAGPLREAVTRLEDVDFVVEHLSAGGRPSLLEGNHMTLKQGQLVKLHGGETMALEDLQGKPGVHAVAGIANPPRFFGMLEQIGIVAEHHPFPDHHRYQINDFASIQAGDTIIMTEKDAVKCRSLPLFDAWYLPVEAILSEKLEEALIRELEKIAAMYETR
jgi:tetraacyldisaccharide 4'-kinase